MITLSDWLGFISSVLIMYFVERKFWQKYTLKNDFRQIFIMDVHVVPVLFLCKNVLVIPMLDLNV